MPAYRSRTSTHGRNMAGARSLWRAPDDRSDFGNPIIAIANSFTQFVPGHSISRTWGSWWRGDREGGRHSEGIQHHRGGRRYRDGH